MRAILIVAMLMSVWLLSAAVNVESINAVDLSQNSSQVTISLSSGSVYTVQRSSSGFGMRVVIPYCKVGKVVPSYPRLSQVLDNITAYAVGSSAVIDIKVMSDLNISHNANADKSQITVTISNPSAPQSKSAVIAQKPKPEIPRKTTPTTPIKAKIDNSAKADTSKVPALAAPTKLPPPPKPKSEKLPHSKKVIKRKFIRFRESHLIYIISVLTLIFVVLVIKQYFRPNIVKKTKTNKDNTIEGTTLLLDSETRTRMVHRLLDQGWTAREIALEMKLGVRDVERIIDIITSSAHDTKG